MKKNYFISIVFLFFTISLSQAQERIVRGSVIDVSGLPLSGVNVLIDNTSQGTQTDFDGNYSISIVNGQSVIFSYLGFETQQVSITSSISTLDIILIEDIESLGEVVITAQGIKKEKKALGYGQTTVAAEALESRPSPDVAKILQGKVAGVTISQTGVTGGGTGINIRGNSFITGNNQALIVVDGVPITTGSNSDGFTGAGDIDSNRLADIDPNNIANMSVLKGLAATALYGNQGVNGVIIITTKSGSGGSAKTGKMDITVTSNSYFTNVSNLPNFQNEHGSGFYLGNLSTANNSFGPLYDGEIIPHILSNNPALEDDFPQFFDDSSTPDIIEGGIPYVGTPNNVKDFFRRGVGRTIGISGSKSFENGAISGSYSNTSDEGFIPNNQLRRDNFSIGGSAKFANKFSFNGAVNFVKNEITAPPISAANGASSFSIFNRLLGVARNFDLQNYPYQNPRDGSNVYYLPGVDNPIWILNNSLSTQRINRSFSNFSLNYELSENATLTYRVGVDIINENQEFYINKGSSSGDATFANGYLRNTDNEQQQWDHSLLLNINFDLSENLKLSGTLGANSNNQTFFSRGAAYQDQVVFNFLQPSNFETVTSNDPFGSTLNRESEQNIIGLYASAELGYKSFLYLTLSGRNDWGSTLETDNQSVFYPSASFSFIPTSAFKGLKGGAINYLKLRGNVSSGAQFPGPYFTRAVLLTNSNAFGTGGTVTQSNSSLIPNPDLKPVTITDFEAGLETKIFNNRVTLETSVYKRISKDQIVQQNVDPSTGGTSTFVNIGEVQTEGIEIALGVTPFKTDNFEWEINANFFADEPIVTELAQGVEELNYAGFSNLGNYAIVGKPLGVIKGSFAVRDANGNFLINPANGEVIPNADVGIPDKIIGDPNPDWNSTIINTIKYKGFELSAQMEYRHGGDIYSLTSQNLYFRGVIDIDGIDRTTYAAAVPGNIAALDADGNIAVTTDDNGVPIGVVSAIDTNGNVIQNEILLPYEDTIFNNVEQNDAENIYDGSTIRLRELSLTYNVLSKLLDRTPFGSLSFKVYGQNLWYDAVNFPDALNYDIESGSTGVGNGAGLEFRTSPSAKNYGLSIKATF
ncbi:MAG: SusC/RagA family TonB-linked outer membrane protein [Flavobacteriaceae bacterium]|nr:SusC/RagA family TonB-linked outer membrane protein [Flavobacteriaceae bacterium]